MYTLQRASLQNSAKLCIHVESSLYVFVSKVQYWLIKEGISVDNSNVQSSQEIIPEAAGIECLCRPSVNVTHSFIPALPQRTAGP